MSLLRLLTAGKSLVGLKEGPGRYKETSAGLLPKFEGKQNPFRPGSAVSSEGGSTEAKPLGAAQADGPARTESVADMPKARPASAGTSGETRLAGLGKKLTSMFGVRKEATKRAIPEFKAPVQTELSLDRVKVVRNDLSDTDLEVVVAKAAAVAGQHKVSAQLSETANAAPKPAAKASIESEVPGETCSAVRST